MNAFEVMRLAQALGEQRRAGESRPSFVPPPREPPVDRTLDLVAAALAGGMIAAGGEAITAEEAVGVYRAVRAGLVHEPYPSKRSGRGSDAALG